MSRRRVGGGRLRVDAARAVAKLRDFQLWDPALWALEVVRAAIALGAPNVRASGDADDVWIAWDGDPIADADMLALFDELVSPVADASRRPLRLLAAGVNSALGVGTSFVDVVASAPDAPTRRVRYTPGVLAVDESTQEDVAVASGLRQLRVEALDTPPRFAPPRGSAVHLRRKRGLAVLGRFLSGTEPRELGALRHACEDAAVAVSVGRATLGGGRSSFDLVRVELGAGLTGFLALTERKPPGFDSASAFLDVGELGVHLVTYALDLGLGDARRPLPVRAWVTAPIMPTNASRSDVRREEPPVSEATAAARSRFPDLVAAVLSRLAIEPKDAAERAHRDRVHAATLELVACFASGALWPVAVRALDDHAIAPLLDAPLVRDAVGRPRSLRDLASKTKAAESETPATHRGRDALDASYAPYLGDLLWTPPGDPAAQMLFDASPPDATAHIKKAKSALAAREAFTRRPVRELQVPDEPSQLASIRIEHVLASTEPWAAALRAAGPLRGEVCVSLPVAGHRFGGRVELRSEGRFVCAESMALGPRFSAVVEGDLLVPSHDFESFDAPEVVAATLRAVRAAVVRACEAVARWLAGEDALPQETRRRRMQEPMRSGDRALVAEVVRHGASHTVAFLAEVGVGRPGAEQDGVGPEAAAKAVTRTKKGEKAARDAMYAWGSSLLGAEVWPMADGSWQSIRGLEKIVRVGTPLGVASPESHDRALPARPIVLAAERDVATLRRLLPRSISLLSYDEAAPDRFDPFRVARDLIAPRSAVLEIRDPRCRGVIAWGNSGLELRHANRVIATLDREGVLAPCRIVLDDDDLVPTTGWTDLSGGSDVRQALELRCVAIEHRMLDALARAVLEMSPSPGLLVDAMVSLRPVGEPLRDQLLTAITRRRPGIEWPAPEVAAKLEEIPLVPVARRGLVSLRALRHDADALAFVPPDAIQPGDDVDPGSWWIVANEDDATSIARAVGREITSAAPRLEQLRAERRRLAAERDHARKPELPLDVRGARGRANVSGDGIVAGVVAIPGVPVDKALVSVRIASREVQAIQLDVCPPVAAAFEVERSMVDPELTHLTDEGKRRVVRRLLDGIDLALRDVAEREPTALLEDRSIAPVFRAHVTGKRPLELAHFADLPIFPSIQGPRVSAKRAIRKGSLQTARASTGWLAPLEGEPRTELDDPVIAVASDADTWLLGQLTGARLADRTDDVAEQRAARRVARGLARRPELPRGIAFVIPQPVEPLVAGSPELARSIGIGDVALTTAGQGRAWLFADGQLRAELPIADPFDGYSIVAALESPLASSGAPSPERARTLERALAVVAERALVTVLVHHAAAAPDWTRDAARSVWTKGVDTSRIGLLDCAFIRTTGGEWVAPRAIDAIAARTGRVSYTSDMGSNVVPDDPGDVVLVLDSFTALRDRDRWRLVDVTDDLRTLAIRRENQKRQAKRTLDLGAAAATASIGHVTLSGADGSTVRGIVAPLMPDATELRSLQLHRAMVPFQQIADPCEWPTASTVDDATLVPDARWESIERNAALVAVEEAVRAASESAIAERCRPPSGVVPLVVDHAVSRRVAPDGHVVLRGSLWIDASLATDRVNVVTPGKTSLRGVGVKVGDVVRPLPLRGTVLAHRQGGGHDAIERALVSLVRFAYPKLVETAMKSDTLSADAVSAHVVTAISAGLLAPKDVRGDERTLACTRPPIAFGKVPAFLRAGGPVLVQKPDEQPSAELVKGNLVIVDDGSLASHAMFLAIGTRAVQVAEVEAARAAEQEAKIRRDAEAEVERIAPTAAAVVGPPTPEPRAPEPKRLTRRERAMSAEERFLDALSKRLASLALTSERLEIVRASGKAPALVVLEPKAGRVKVKLDAPLGQRLLRALDASSTSPPAAAAIEDVLDLLSAHIAGELDRAHENVTHDHHLRALVALLEAPR